MSIFAKVVFRKTRERIYADVGRHLNLKVHDKIILETEHGVESGIICVEGKNIEKNVISTGKILRKLTIEDKKRIIENEIKDLKAKNVVIQKTKIRNLDMKLTCVQYIFDRSKLFVYYTSETRVDFRELIKDLGHVLKTRIQMVQIGVRDETKMLGGIGTCGQVLCCKAFLENFNSVTMDMAKEQNLSLNTIKLSGLCGRLMCCISYENSIYKNIRKKLPELETIIVTPEGRAKLVAIDCMRELITVDFGNKEFKVFSIKQIINI
ncbi:MAG: stage 0 sporulation protein [Endomicrobium sp.]|jgi:cell fate regulator YaaT (PSP1 superfamily)|nr:stage 0 sporulation protein [Endomicrobium sp.]